MLGVIIPSTTFYLSLINYFLTLSRPSTFPLESINLSYSFGLNAKTCVISCKIVFV